MPTVRVKGLDAPLEVEAGADLLSACRKERVNLFWGPWARLLNCRGAGLCTLRKVDVLEGADNLTPHTKREKKRLVRKPDHWRLACQAKVTGDVAIDPYPLVPIEERVSAEAIDLAQLSAGERRLARLEAHEAALETLEVPKRERAGLLARFRKKDKDVDESERPKRRLPFGKKKDEGDAGAAAEAKAARKREKEAAKAAKAAKKTKKADTKGEAQEEPVET